jgi:hypothetical protein
MILRIIFGLVGWLSHESRGQDKGNRITSKESSVYSVYGPMDQECDGFCYDCDGGCAE